MRGKIIHYNGNDGKGLISAGDRQLPFNIGQWSCDSAPAVNQTVEVTLDETGSPARIVIVDAQTLAREKLSQFASMGGDQGQQAATRGKAVFDQVSGRMGKPTLIACVALWLAWFFLPAVSIDAVFMTKSLTFSEVIGYSVAHPENGGSFGFFSFVGVICIVVPWVAPWLTQRWAPRLNFAPLTFVVMFLIRLKWQMHSAVSQALDSAGGYGGEQGTAMANQMMQNISDQLSKAISIGWGFWIVLLASVALAVVGFLGHRARAVKAPAVV